VTKGVRIVAAAALLSVAAAGWLWAARRSGPASAPRQAIAPRSAAEWYERGRELASDSRNLPGAIEAYREALALEPQHAEAHYGLGLALLQSGDAEGAAAEIESALSLAPQGASWRQDAENALVLALLRKPRSSQR
jgi:Flp pilus assembly protein TadD